MGMDLTKSPLLARAPGIDSQAGDTPEVTALVVRAQAGEADAFDALMRLYEARIVALGRQMGLRREDALDACQDTFVKVFRYIRRFHTERSFYKWLYRIALHVVYDQLRRARPQATVSIEDLGPAGGAELTEPGEPLDSKVATADLRKKLLAGLGCLSPRERTVFVLRDLQEMDTAEIGAILRISQITVRRHCLLARQKLRERVFPPQS